MNANEVAQSGSTPKTAKPKRRTELDLLRGLVVLALIPFHTATYFIEGGWAPLHYTPSPVVKVMIYFSFLVAMPLLFYIAGMGVNYSLRKRTAGAFVVNRFQRLLIPLTLGHLLLLPIIEFYAFRRSPLFDETFAQFYPTFFNLTLKIDFPPFLEGPRYAAHHLWFLKDLLVYTLVLLPLFLWLRSASGRRLVERLAVVSVQPWTIFLLALPVAVIEAVLGASGAWNRFSYIPFIIYGFLLVADPRFGEALRRIWKAGLLLGLLLFATVGIAGISYFTQGGIDFQTDPGTPSVLFRLLKGTLAWFLIVGIMGMGESIGSRRAQEASVNQQGQELDRRPTLISRAAQYLSRATLPIYTLHLTFVVVIGFYVVQWTSNMWVRFLVITVVSMLGTLAAYDIVRRNRLTRFLFGMRTRTDRISPPGAEQRGIGGWVSANLPHLGLWATTVLFTVLIVVAASNASLVGRWEQTLDTIQPATGYIVEFRADGTWTATAEGETTDGSYELIAGDQIKIIYADGTTAVAGYRISYDRFGLINSDGERQQIFMRVP